MSELEFEALKRDLDENGQRDPIILFEGKILDGRNRYRACRELGIEPLTDAFKGSLEDARQLSTTANLMRRHLSKSQKAMFLALGGFLTPSAPKGRRRKFGEGDQSPRELGKKYGVNHMTLYKAADIAQRNNALAQRVLKGELSVGAAEIELKKQSTKGTLQKRKTGGTPVTNATKLPRHLVKVFQTIEEIESLETAISEARKSLKAVVASDVFDASDLKDIRTSLNTVWDKLKRNKPSRVCDACKGKGCGKCDKKGWLAER
jgi:hypothetical protein